MIRKMLAMLVAISCAFGAWADATHISGTDFSTHGTGDFITGRDDSGAATESTYWYNGNTNDFSGTIVLGTNGTDHVLDFESNITNPVYRTIEGCYGRTVTNFVPHAVGSGLFVDTYVSFTPYLVNENHPAPEPVTAQDKIVVWVRETEVEEGANITNLIVTAGYYNDNNVASVSNYVTSLSSADVSGLCNGQHRLTIKAIENITEQANRVVVGFVVYIDGDIDPTPLTYEADAFSSGNTLTLTPQAQRYYSPSNHKLFPTLTGYKTSVDQVSISSVGYAGVGQIGEVWFDDYTTSYPAFAGDNRDFIVQAGPDIISYMYDGQTYSGTNAHQTFITDSFIVISNVQYAAGWKHKDDTWFNISAVVSNRNDATYGDYGTMYFADGTTLTLAGFKANYSVGGEEFQTLFGGTTTEPEGAIAYAVRTHGTLTLNKSTVIAEGDNTYISLTEGALTIDLNGYTLQGTDSTYATIEIDGGNLVVVDNSELKTGKVLASTNCDPESPFAITIYDGSASLSDGTYDIINIDDTAGNPEVVINSGRYYDQLVDNPTTTEDFYLCNCLAEGKSVIDWTEETKGWYATVGDSSGDRWDITFSTNNVVVTEWNLTVDDGDPIGNHIPNFTGGSWDAPAPTAETIVTSDTNFNYTIETSYTLTYATEYGAVPDGVVYTASTPDFALAAAPVTEVVGIEFAGWVIGSVTNAAGATYVVADHLENTTATAAWAPVVPTGTAIYLVMGSGVDSISTSFNGTDWTAYTDPLQDVELGSTLYIKGTSSVTGYDVPQFSIVVDNTHATEQTALVVNKSAIVYFPQTAIEQQWADRNGTAAKPFVIRNYDDLVALKNGVANGTVTNQCFEQVANIDMDGEEPWAGIGTFECRTAGSGAFEGTYDGGNYAISNVTFDQHEYNGIFASVVGGVIKNLTVDVDGFAATSAFGGAAIAGVAKNCFLTNLVATGTIIGQSSTPCTHSAAGIAVRMEGTVAYACTNRCEIWSGKGKLGGIAAMGQGDRADSLILCSNEGDIHGTKTGGLGDGGVGGIFGYQGYGDGYQAVTYTNCRNIGQVTSLSSDKTGSILGHHSNSGPSFVGTIITLDNMLVSGYSEGSDGVTYGKSIGGGLVELCTQAAFETNNTYSTMWSGLTPTFAFEAAGTISFNTNLFQATAFAITGPQGYEVTSSEAGGIVTFTCAIPGPADPWAPAAETDEAAAAKAVELFGAESEVAANVDTLAEYNALVTYIKSVTSQSEVPTDLTADEKTWMWKSFILGANPLFDEEPAVQITSLTAGATAGLWDFTVKVTEGDDTDAYNVAADKVGALVKISSSLTSGTWVAPTAGNISAVKLLGGNLIQVEVNFGDGTSGFMKVSEE